MAGILECPVEQQSIMKRLANNRFAALSEEDDEEHGGRPTMTDMYATNRHAAIKYNDVLAKETRMKNDGDMSTGTTHSTDTVRRSNIMPGRAMTRGEAWNVIKERNWVQQTIADRDKRWCPTCMSKQLSPAKRVGAQEYLARLMGNKNELTWACANSGCTANVFIPGTPLKNLRPTTKPIRLKTASGEWIETTHEGEIGIPGLPKAARKAHICPGLANMSLVGVKTLVDARCEVLFSKDDYIVLYKGSIVWKGGRQARSGLWILPLSPEGVEEINKLQIEPTVRLATVKQLRKEAEVTNQTEDKQVNNVFHTTTKAELIKYLHQAAFSPVKATWKKAIENRHFTTWPGLTVEAVEKYLPRHSPATDKGHMSRQKQGVRPTKIEKWAAKTIRNSGNKRVARKQPHG